MSIRYYTTLLLIDLLSLLLKAILHLNYYFLLWKICISINLPIIIIINTKAIPFHNLYSTIFCLISCTNPIQITLTKQVATWSSCIIFLLQTWKIYEGTSECSFNFLFIKVNFLNNAILCVIPVITVLSACEYNTLLLRYTTITFKT